VKRALRLLHRERKTVVPRPAPVSRDIGVLGLDTRVKGDVTFQGALTVDGNVSGHIHAPEGSGATLVVGQYATVAGDIVSDSVLISGRVTGNVKASERLEIFGTGVLLGDVETGDIMIQAGAEFQGRCQMLKKPPGPAASPEPPAAASTDEPHTDMAAGDSARKGRKHKGNRHERAEGRGGQDDGMPEAATQGIAVQQDPRTERGGSTEGPSA